MKSGTKIFAISLLLTICCNAFAVRDRILADQGVGEAIAQIPFSPKFSAIETVQAANPPTVATNKSWQNARLVRTLPPSYTNSRKA
ncbi:hypothetical protein [Nostoc sp. 106C]|uniref:hypothetical protein n=1 Tax=Nostoc sp. 106C TaxID=1932667 RepID=UPI000A3A54BC|nr:hypothetical protein [Nostoc sp. 106C]OUL23393.1 hypothetical protein BV375_26065 [Nostoc sp. 106C]